MEIQVTVYRQALRWLDGGSRFLHDPLHILIARPADEFTSDRLLGNKG